jgi:hypothetical protein
MSEEGWISGGVIHQHSSTDEFDDTTSSPADAPQELPLTMKPAMIATSVYTTSILSLRFTLNQLEWNPTVGFRSKMQDKLHQSLRHRLLAWILLSIYNVWNAIGRENISSLDRTNMLIQNGLVIFVVTLYFALMTKASHLEKRVGKLNLRRASLLSMSNRVVQKVRANSHSLMCALVFTMMMLYVPWICLDQTTGVCDDPKTELKLAFYLILIPTIAYGCAIHFAEFAIMILFFFGAHFLCIFYPVFIGDSTQDEDKTRMLIAAHVIGVGE